ncbi:MAG TPA: amidohydrolase family protein [Candidatus Limnocylindrales bacterium]|nr:amidohydrolase family protein [Candidatus Limnocylindrales bacterium]
MGVHALIGGKVIPKPGEVVDGGTIVIRDGLIEAVSTNLTPPADARIWDMNGKTIYAGFIDPYLVLDGGNPRISTSDAEPDRSNLTAAGTKFYGVAGSQSDMGKAGPGYEIARITPEYRAGRNYSPKEKALKPLREIGFTAGVVVPEKGIIRGTSALVALSEENPNEVIIRSDVFQHIGFETRQADDRGYPSSLMGVIASVRQSFFDAQHYALDQTDYQKHPQGRKRSEFDPALEALQSVVEKRMRVVFEPGSALMVDRAARVAAELGIDFLEVSSGQEWRRPDLAKAARTSFIVPLDFPTLPKLPNEDDWEQVQLDTLRAWDWAAENPALLRQQDLEIALTTYGLSDKKKFRENLQLAVDRGLSEKDALAGLTTVPAKLCGAENLLGTIETGKLANLTIVDGTNYFNPENKVAAVWIDGRVYEAPSEEPKAEKSKPDKVAAAEQTPSKPKEEPEKHAKPPEVAANEQKPDDKVSEDKTEKKEKDKDKSKDRARELKKKRVARAPLTDRGPLAEPPAVLIQGATLWTCGPQGRLEQSDLLVVGGKIKAVGKDLSGRSDFAGPPLIIDGRGLHVTPGLIDCHSHTAILDGVNEATLPSTAMVRIRDVVNSETDNLYEQLAGGVTTVNLLHGSANPIGGQNCVIKLRDGASPEGLIFADAPAGIKFALGENVKQSNWGGRNTTRFPQTRMGVQTFIANRFTAAQEYLKSLQQAGQSEGSSPRGPITNVPPRRNLELEAIGEIIQGKRWIHCHSYRQDEILMLIRLMEGFGVKIATFQHVLEGYKVADEIARHGAGGSTFSDWWAYKFEVYDAIPYNGSLMRDRGVVVSFNSDDSELARRLYMEAAKAVKYGGTLEVEALKFVTFNPAVQLHIDSHVGSLEPGKDGDFAIWSKSPLDSGTVCQQTWIEGRKYFDRALNAERAGRLQKERDDLIAKAKQIAKPEVGGDSAADKDSKGAQQFFRLSLEHEFDGKSRGCLDEE